jgi:transcriptional regulator of arginine metabolism
VNGGTAARRRRVRELVASRTVGSQAQLRSLLADAGFEVTQATVSRDLDAIGAVKVRNGQSPHYELARRGPEEEHRAALGQAVAEFVESVATSGNLIVIRVPPGAADLVASRMDAAGIDGVLGTVAGDDTLLVVVEEGVGAASVAAAIEGASK